MSMETVDIYEITSDESIIQKTCNKYMSAGGMGE